ncbi:nuclease [Citrus sinensis]|nr:nuclease [Citrus sinensis]
MTANNNICMVHYLNQLNNKVIHGGSVTGHITINRDLEMTDRNLFNDYFSKNPGFNDSMFRRRLRMSRSLFSHITNVVQDSVVQLWKFLQSNILDHPTLMTSPDYSMLVKSMVFQECITPPAHYVIKWNKYNIGYYLADDVERAIGVLKTRFVIVAAPSRFLNKHVLHDIMVMSDVNATINDWMQAPIPTVDIRVDDNTRFQEFLAQYKQIQDKEAQIAL